MAGRSVWIPGCHCEVLVLVEDNEGSLAAGTFVHIINANEVHYGRYSPQFGKYGYVQAVKNKAFLVAF